MRLVLWEKKGVGVEVCRLEPIKRDRVLTGVEVNCVEFVIPLQNTVGAIIWFL